MAFEHAKEVLILSATIKASSKSVDGMRTTNSLTAVSSQDISLPQAAFGYI